jgi:hypothetical protein
MNPDKCEVCSLSKTSEWFWNAHQTMSDGKIWCVNAKRS